MIAGWLVEAKQSVIENIAPVLTKVFTPLFTLLLLALDRRRPRPGLNLVDSERDLLILFDVTLIVVLGAAAVLDVGARARRGAWRGSIGSSC